MRQAIHIFFKDTRFSVAYIAICLGIVATLAILTPRWMPWYSPTIIQLNYTVDILQMLLPVAWWFTSAHIVQREGLVGDRRFWLTRPYSRSLLLAKGLFCIVFLTVPMLIGDCAILSAEGFSSGPLIPSLLLRHCVLAVTIMLPAFVLASLTGYIAQFVLACFMIAIAFFTAATFHQPLEIMVEAAFDTPHFPSSSWLQIWGATIVFAACGTTLLLWQYGRRQTVVVRTVAIVAFVCGMAPSAGLSRLTPLTANEQPRASLARYPEISVTYAPERGPRRHDRCSDLVQLDIPIALNGRSRDLLECGLARIRITPTQGVDWTSGWTWRNYTVGNGSDWIHLELDPRTF
jgi:hypothetical protein